MFQARPLKFIVDDAVRVLGQSSSLHDIYFQIQRSMKILYDLGAIRDTVHALVADGVFVWHEPDNTFSKASDDPQLYLF